MLKASNNAALVSRFRPPRIHAIVISWHDMHLKASQIADRICSHVEQLSVIYSNHEGQTESGPGNWIGVSQELFFGQKFLCALDLCHPDDTMLLIQADAECDDWPKLVKRCHKVFSFYEGIGVWAPDIDNTPYRDCVISEFPHKDSHLLQVAQTDGVVVAFSPRLLSRLGQLDYDSNQLGWGIDWAAISIAHSAGDFVVRDTSIQVHHPLSRGYPAQAAQSQMVAFLEQLSEQERASYSRLSKLVETRQRRRVTPSSTPIQLPAANKNMTEIKQFPETSPSLLDTVSFAILVDGDVLFKVPFHQNSMENVFVKWAGNSASLVPLSEPRPFFDIPETIELADIDTPTIEGRTLDGAEQWGCQFQSTLRLLVKEWEQAETVSLGQPVHIPEDTGEIWLFCSLATHRATADLKVSITSEQEAEVQDIYTKFEPEFTGNRSQNDFQQVRIRIPRSRTARSLQLSVCFWGSNAASPDKPPVLFITQPTLISVGRVNASLNPIILSSPDSAPGQWFSTHLNNVRGGLELSYPDQVTPILVPEEIEFSVRHRDSSALTLSASQAAQVVLYVDNLPLMPLELGTEPVDVELPMDYSTHVLELRDCSGTITYAQYADVTTIEGAPSLAESEPGVVSAGSGLKVKAIEQSHPDYSAIEELFDADFYKSGFSEGEAPNDLVSHYLTEGWLQGRDPAPWFSTRHYLARYPDVKLAGINPFLHYVIAGKNEGRKLQRLGRKTNNIYEAHAEAVSAGPLFEDFDPNLGNGRKPRAKVLAYYLPQFHTIAENDVNWGAGFTEWRNIPRGLPRFEGHIQPRIPRDLGWYDLSETDVMRRQVDMARAAGLHGFCFYHYWFDGKRALEAPMNRFLADPTLDFPFALIWANENWTRTWDGHDKDVILKQNYLEEDDEAFVKDLARHFKDKRYINIDGRPLFFIYRPGQIPNASEKIALWRDTLQERHGFNPLIYMAQGFGDLDPRIYGLDGAIEFPPHKLCEDLPHLNATLNILDPDFSGYVLDYDALIERAVSEPASAFPLIRTVTPNWDNEARRPGRGMALRGSTPKKFENWMRRTIEYARENPVEGTPFVCVNAWNEWAEGAYLEPDVHFGGAYLNSLSRAVHGTVAQAKGARTKVVIISHDAHLNGAQMLAINIGKIMTRDFGIDVAYIIGETGPLLSKFEEIGNVHVVSSKDTQKVEEIVYGLASQGYTFAISNTSVTGGFVGSLKLAGFVVISLIHELPALLRSYNLEPEVREIALGSDRVIFPAEVVRDGFQSIAEHDIQGEIEVFPQGLYNEALADLQPGDEGMRKQLGLSENTKIVLGVGFADLRKGIDRFISTAIELCTRHDEIAFVWVGNPAPEAQSWYIPEIEKAGLTDRILITGHVDNVAKYYAASDLFFLTSREDPFPSVVIEALAIGLPIVGYEGCGGCDPLIARHGSLIQANRLDAAGSEILKVLETPKNQAEQNAKLRRAEIAENYRFDEYVYGLLQRFDPSMPSVSVVVPNYNYENHIANRLQTIFDQEMPVREILVLDDASSDNSLEVINSVSQSAARKVDLHLNEENSGSPFSQWRKGVEMVCGNYVWIAEADDLATPDFLARVVARMEKTGAVLGFSDSWQIDENDNTIGESYKPYINSIEPSMFDRSFDMEGKDFLRRCLSIKNVILNVSGVVFRKDALLAALKEVGSDLDTYSVAGDWRLYAEICAADGRVAFEAAPLNGHRRHATSVTHALNVEKHLAEIQSMHNFAASRVDLSEETKSKQEQHMRECQQHLVKK